MPLTQAAGRGFHVQMLGPRKSGDAAGGEEGPAVVMVHGLVLGTLASWYFTVAPRLARRRRVLLYDQRGHGLSEPARDGYDLATLADDLAAVVDVSLGPAERVDVVGHSYGGAIVLEFALARPERVRRVVLVDAPMPPFEEPEARRFLETDPEAVLAELPGKVDAAFLGGPKRWARRMGTAVRFREDTTIAEDLAAEGGFDAAELAGVARPALLVYGETSEFRPVGEELASRLPDAALTLLPGGHFLHLQETERLTAAIEGFLDAPADLG